MLFPSFFSIFWFALIAFEYIWIFIFIIIQYFSSFFLPQCIFVSVIRSLLMKFLLYNLPNFSVFDFALIAFEFIWILIILRISLFSYFLNVTDFWCYQKFVDKTFLIQFTYFFSICFCVDCIWVSLNFDHFEDFPFFLLFVWIFFWCYRKFVDENFFLYYWHNFSVSDFPLIGCEFLWILIIWRITLFLFLQ